MGVLIFKGIVENKLSVLLAPYVSKMYWVLLSSLFVPHFSKVKEQICFNV